MIWIMGNQIWICRWKLC